MFGASCRINSSHCFRYATTTNSTSGILSLYKEKVLRSTHLVAKPVHHQSANETTERDRNSPQFPYRRLHELNRRRPHQLAASPLVAIQNNGRTPHRLVATLYSRLHELNRPLPPSACREPPRGHPEQRAHTTSPSSYPYKQRDGVMRLSLLRHLTAAHRSANTA